MRKEGWDELRKLTPNRFSNLMKLLNQNRSRPTIVISKVMRVDLANGLNIWWSSTTDGRKIVQLLTSGRTQTGDWLIPVGTILLVNKSKLIQLSKWEVPGEEATHLSPASKSTACTSTVPIKLWTRNDDENIFVSRSLIFNNDKLHESVRNYEQARRKYHTPGVRLSRWGELSLRWHPEKRRLCDRDLFYMRTETLRAGL